MTSLGDSLLSKTHFSDMRQSLDQLGRDVDRARANRKAAIAALQAADGALDRASHAYHIELTHPTQGED